MMNVTMQCSMKAIQNMIYARNKMSEEDGVDRDQVINTRISEDGTWEHLKFSIFNGEVMDHPCSVK